MPDARPLYQRPAMLALVFLGGAAGTFTRWLVAHVLGDPAHFPHGTLTVNLVGAFLLGLLLAFLESRGPETPRRRDVRLLIGTGFMGGFTTYSAFAVQQVRLLGVVGVGGGAVAGVSGGAAQFSASHLLPLLLYGGVSLAAGLAGALLGMAAGSLVGAALGRRECRRTGGGQCLGAQCQGAHCQRPRRDGDPGQEPNRDNGPSGKGPRDG